jgi:glycosyltransferase involved in cell wall biosynthesis
MKVPAPDPNQAVSGLADAMTRLARDPDLRARMGQAGQKRVKEIYDWDVKGQVLVQLYEKVLTRK